MIRSDRKRISHEPAPTSDRVIIVGAGMAGLSAAVLLAARGLAVTVVEAADHAGGKIRAVPVAGRPVDSGPTVVTMRWAFEELFDDAGTRLDDHLTLRPAEILARHAWSRDERLDLFADPERSAAAIADFAGIAEADRYRDFCDHAARVYRSMEAPFIRGPRPTPIGLSLAGGLSGARDLAAAQPFATLWDALGRRFRDPRLRQLYARYATYCGASPFAAPATLMLIAHVEQSGVWTIDGGMTRLPEAMTAVAASHGAAFRFSTGAETILTDGGRTTGVRLDDGETLRADAVLFCGDVSALGSGLLGEAVRGAATATAPGRRSLSALTLSMVAETDGFPLVRHNVFFGDDYRGEFEDLFRHRRLPHRPTVYLCAQDQDAGDGEGDRTTGPERLFAIINAPATGDTETFEDEETQRCTESAMALMARCGLTLAGNPAQRVVTSPADFARRFPGTGGAIYGPAGHGWKAAFERNGAQTRLPGLYLAGGSVHPGPGIAMAALSGRRAAERILTDLTSRNRSRRVAMPGGMSMRSATTGPAD
ncbi:1-hydroxycarotenoid 3,4-desaturase CrtD [Thalassobaculum salexigens]|uniref:1-hydroxycarotenoid 3,4-desaturase CrtD n=1 Tax=Thalassobaculum salexigens TaxID=455360 RepID=UPI00248E3CBE|nr:1-hydroxycarotenoid 3,4-desaturase CrtD [Thalassobaculum salexigens]